MLPRKELEGLSAAALFEIAARDFRPPMRESIPVYAERHRFLPDPGGGRGPRWRNDKTPYLVEPSEDITSGEYQTVCVVGPGQVGKTVIPENWLLHSVATDPANMLWYMQSDEALEAYVKDRINPMIDSHDELDRAKGLRSIDDSLHYKRFRGMSLQLLTASKANLISKNAPRIVADEIDAYPAQFGDVKVLLDVRRQRFGSESMLLVISHPDRAKGLRPDKDWGAGIMSIYADSTLCMWYWKCPHCGVWSSPCPLAPRYMAINYKTHHTPEEVKAGAADEYTLDEIEAMACLACPVNGCAIADHERDAMNRGGVWVGEGQTIDPDGRIRGKRIERKTSGYWIVGAMSPFMLNGIGGLARARVKAEREMEATGEDQTLREVIVKQWGFPYAPQRAVGSIDANDLADRAEPDLKLGVVPDGVRFLTCAVDANLSFFEFLVRGWGRNGESWIIDRGKILAETATSAEDWEKLIKLFGRSYPLGDESGRTMQIRAGIFDSGGAAGVAQQAYMAWTRWRKAKRISFYGKIGGREAFSVLPSRGANTINAAKLTIIYPDTPRKASQIAARGEVPVASFNPNLFKDDLAGQLMRGEEGPWYVHFPFELRSKEQPHLWFEQVVSERRLLNGRWEKLNPNARNEALDLLVLTHVCAHLHGLTRINWDKPPPWADVWSKNVMVAAAPAIDPKGKKVVDARSNGGAVKIKIDPTSKKTIGSRLA